MVLQVSFDCVARAKYDLMAHYCSVEEDLTVVGLLGSNLARAEPVGASRIGISSLQVYLEWKKPKGVLERPTALSHSRTVALIKAVVIPGDPRLPCFSGYDELQLLKGFQTGLETGEVKWRQCLVSEGTTVLDQGDVASASVEAEISSILDVCKPRGPTTFARGARIFFCPQL